MTMTYCGKCGSANGAAASYCRSCGVELSNQDALPATSTPPGLELMAGPTPPSEKSPRRNNAAPQNLKESDAAQNLNQDATKPALTRNKNTPPPPPAPPLPNAAAKADPPALQDQKVSSQSLRSLRASMTLPLDNAQEKQERWNQINAESVKRPSPDKTATPPQPPKQIITEGSSAALSVPAIKTIATEAALPATSAKPAPASGAAPPLPRRAASQLTLSSSARNAGSPSSPGPALSQGPASVLVQASGLKTQSNLNSRLLLALIALISVLVLGTYLLVGDRLVAPGRSPEIGRNLVRAQDQSAELISAGGRHLERGDLFAAIDSFRGALELNPSNEQALFKLAQTQASVGQINEALKNFQALLRLNPDHLAARLQVAENLRAQRNWSAAHAEYQRIIAYDQNNPQATAALEAIEKKMSNKPVESDVVEVSLPRTVMARALLPPPVYDAQARLPLEPQRMASAGSIKPPAVERGPEEKPAAPRGLADPHKQLGMRYFNIREYRAAINQFLAALRTAPGDNDLYYLLGSSYHGLGQLALAYDYYRRVDGGPYRDVAAAGARQTEKAAREEFKRRESLRRGVKNDASGKAPRAGVLNDSLE